MKHLSTLLLCALPLMLLPRLTQASAGTVATVCAATFGAPGETDTIRAHFEWDVPSLFANVTEKLYLRSGHYDMQHGFVVTGSWLIHSESYTAAGSGFSDPTYSLFWQPYKRQWFGEYMSYCTQIEVVTLAGKLYVARSNWTRDSPRR